MSTASTVSPVSVKLPCGFFIDKKLVKDAQITPMTGAVRKMIASPKVRQNPASIVDTLLSSCVVSIGGQSRLRNADFMRMFLADRDFLMIEIRKISLGDTVTATLQCDSCKEKLDVKINLDRDVPVKSLEGEDFQIDAESEIVTFKIKREGIDARFRLPIGEDQHYVAPLFRKNPIDANYALYERCLLEWNGTPAGECEPRLFENLLLPTLNILDEEFARVLPGPDMRVPADCPYCQNEITVGMESSDFLFQLPKREKT